MRNRNFLMLASAATVVLLICGDQTSDAGIQGSGRARMMAYGRITGFGSVYVNDIKFSTTQAQVIINDKPASEADLKLGQVVLVEGDLNADGTTGTADTVNYSSSLRGVITQLDILNDLLMILGQKVRITDATLIDEAVQPSLLSLLQLGSRVRVTGFVNSAGELVASRIDREAASGALQVRGTVRDLNTLLRTFRVNSLIVSYALAAVEGPLANGKQVKVAGASVLNTGVMLATSIKPAPLFNAQENDQASLEGLITRYISDTNFEIDGQRVLAGEDTQLILNGGSLGLNAPVRVLGIINGSGELLASRIAVNP